MLNKEKYIDVIIEDMLGVCCDNRVIQMAIGECDNDIDCTTCFNKVVKWLNEEYVEVVEGKNIFHRKSVGGKVVGNEYKK